MTSYNWPPGQQPDGKVTYYDGNGHGSTNTKIRKYVNLANSGTAFTAVSVANSATLGAAVTCLFNGRVAVYVADGHSSAAALGASVNSNQLTTASGNITAAHRLMTFDNGAGLMNGCSRVIEVAVGDVIRPHDDGTPTNTTERVTFVVEELERY